MCFHCKHSWKWQIRLSISQLPLCLPFFTLGPFSEQLQNPCLASPRHRGTACRRDSRPFRCIETRLSIVFSYVSSVSRLFSACFGPPRCLDPPEGSGSEAPPPRCTCRLTIATQQETSTFLLGDGHLEPPKGRRLEAKDGFKTRSQAHFWPRISSTCRSSAKSRKASQRDS